MLKRVLVSIVALLTLAFVVTITGATEGANKAAAATVVNAPTAVGTYNDFGQYVRLRINPKGTNAVKFKISYKEYGATDYISYEVDATPNITVNYVSYVQTYFHVNTQGVCLISVQSEAADGTLSAPFNTFVNVMR